MSDQLKQVIAHLDHTAEGESPASVPSSPAVKPQPDGPVYKDFTLESATKYLTDLGFVFEGKRDSGISAELHVYIHPTTRQRANLSYYYRDKQDKPINEAKVVFHRAVPPKRRTREEKRRQNWVQYD